jgi:hypothetical protein
MSLLLLSQKKESWSATMEAIETSDSTNIISYDGNSLIKLYFIS